ncbi:STAS domain-containing protein [Streptomyces sp. NPDC052687]|uniref:STAS domain-containing protein n=1 Tax=Streptomyces sp. NPDC052687 TaxID=3154759 RepID=UPI003440843D
MTDHNLTVTHDDHPSGATVLAVAGELDHHTARTLTFALDEAPFTAGARLVIDLSALTYCDSTGITVFVSAYQRAQAAGCSLTLAGVRHDLMRVFRIVGLDQLFTFQPTIEDAVGTTQP